MIEPTIDRLVAASATPCEAALLYVQLGWPCFPAFWVQMAGCSCGNSSCTSPGKHPYSRVVPRGVLDATLDPKEIIDCWTSLPQANVAIRTGQESGLVVLDVDPRNGGTESLRRLQSDIGALPSTLVVQTGGGGLHFYFRYPQADIRFSSKVAGYDGLDVKADGGYVLAPPSTHISGNRYAWVQS